MEADRIPDALSSELQAKAKEARGLLTLVKSKTGNLKEKDGSFYKTVLYRFKKTASELTHRYDTMAYFVPEEVLKAEAEKSGCLWDPSGRRFVVQV